VSVESKSRILVVDDDPDVRALARSVLAGAGYRVDCAGSGLDALEMLSEQDFDLVLLDINMPEMDGWETLRLIRADDDHGELAVAMFSVKNEVHDRIHGLQDGATDYITKPFAVDTLIQRVGHVLAARSR
jgi:DNA-binding response OmpR family regulator